jgi:protein gp37
VDPSCRYCYAADATRLQIANGVELYKDTIEYRNDRWTWTGNLTVLEDDHSTWSSFLRQRFPQPPLFGPGKPSILWLNSMADLYHPGRPIEAINRILVTVALAPHIIGLIVTKHPAQMVAYFRTKPAWWRKRFILVFSAGDQRWLDVRWRIMRPLAEQGWRVGVSLQPLLGPVVLPPDFLRLGKWVIVGGEQHPGHRVMDPNWARALRDQCLGADPKMPLFVKQMTSLWRPPDLLYQQFPEI